MLPEPSSSESTTSPPPPPEPLPDALPPVSADAMRAVQSILADDTADEDMRLEWAINDVMPELQKRIDARDAAIKLGRKLRKLGLCLYIEHGSLRVEPKQLVTDALAAEIATRRVQLEELIDDELAQAPPWSVRGLFSKRAK